MPFAFWHSLVNLPPPESCIVYPKRERQRSPSEAMMATISHQVFPERARFRIGVTAQKFDDPWPMLHGWIAAVLFPVSIGFFLQFEAYP